MGAWKKSYNSLQQMLDDLHPDNGADIDTGHQINETKRTATALVSSAIVGDPEGDEEKKVPKKDFNIVLEGYANPDRQAPDGGTKDWVRIYIQQK